MSRVRWRNVISAGRGYSSGLTRRGGRVHGPPLRWLDVRVPRLRGLPADRRPAHGDRGARRVDRARRPLPDPARRHRDREDGDDGVDRRAGAEADARDRPQQDARRAALQRVPRVPAGERGRVLRLLLRLLPAGGLRPAGRPLHREGRVDQRRHRPAAARGHGGAPGAQGRAHRRLGLVHLRHRLAARPTRRRRSRSASARRSTAT